MHKILPGQDSWIGWVSWDNYQLGWARRRTQKSLSSMFLQKNGWVRLFYWKLSVVGVLTCKELIANKAYYSWKYLGFRSGPCQRCTTKLLETCSQATEWWPYQKLTGRRLRFILGCRWLHSQVVLALILSISQLNQIMLRKYSER